MKPARYREEWRRLLGAWRDTAENRSTFASLAVRAAYSFIDRHFYSAEYNADCIDLLCEMATQAPNPALGEAAAWALFGIVIERLCDDFEELQTGTYNRVVSQVTDFLRQLPTRTAARRDAAATAAAEGKDAAGQLEASAAATQGDAATAAAEGKDAARRLQARTAAVQGDAATVAAEGKGAARQLEASAALHARLNEFGLHSAEALFQRIEAIRLQPDPPVPKRLRPQKALVLSRVTIGADIAITSIVCQRLRSRFPDAEIVLIGSGKLRQLFAEGSGVRVAELAYTRRGGLLERFNAWLALLALVRQETAGMPEDGYLVLDPDSRLTQLGVLPLVDDSRYRFFNSRSRPEDPATASMSELANLWLDRTLQTNDFCYPKVWLPEAEQARAQELLQGARAAGRRIIALNLGVGGNERKRVSNAFERELALNLLADPANLVLLDLGFGATEVRRSRAILRAAQQAGIKVGIGGFADLSQRLVDGGHRLPAGSAGGLATRGQFAKDTRLPAGSAGGLMTLGQLAEDTRLLGVESTMAEVGALIACSDEFIGYDSACQHLAAALGVPTYTIFAGATNPRFVRRWHAFGPAKNEIVFVDTVSRDPPPDPQEIIARLEDLRRD